MCKAGGDQTRSRVDRPASGVESPSPSLMQARNRGSPLNTGYKVRDEDLPTALGEQRRTVCSFVGAPERRRVALSHEPRNSPSRTVRRGCRAGERRRDSQEEVDLRGRAHVRHLERVRVKLGRVNASRDGCKDKEEDKQEASSSMSILSSAAGTGQTRLTSHDLELQSG
jgi:hypothetical protein